MHRETVLCGKTMGKGNKKGGIGFCTSPFFTDLCTTPALPIIKMTAEQKIAPVFLYLPHSIKVFERSLRGTFIKKSPSNKLQ